MRIGRAEGKRGYAIGPLLVLSLVNLVDQVDVNILRGVLELIKDDWDVSDFALGLLGFAFIFVHTIAAIPSGWVADRYRRSRIIGYTMLSWSALSVAAATAVNYPNLLAARAGLGVGQAVDDPSSTSLLSDYYPPRLRGRVFSIQQVMTFVGSGLGIALGGWVGQRFGWRWAFALVGTPGIVVAFLAFRLRNPVRGEAHQIETTGTAVEKPREVAALPSGFGPFVGQVWREVVSEIRMIFGIRTMRYVLVGVGILLFTVSGVGFWLAVYHDRYSGMTLAQATATTGGVLGLGGIVGTIWGGRLADRLYGQGPSGRITLVASGIIATTVLFIASYNVAWIPGRVGLQFFGVFAISGAIPGLRASMTDVVPAESMGMGVSAFSLVSALFGTALAPPLVGLLSDLTGSLLAAFYIVSPPIVIGSLILLRARATIAEDAEAIIRSMMERAQGPTDADATS